VVGWIGVEIDGLKVLGKSGKDGSMIASTIPRTIVSSDRLVMILSDP